MTSTSGSESDSLDLEGALQEKASGAPGSGAEAHGDEPDPAEGFDEESADDDAEARMAFEQALQESFASESIEQGAVVRGVIMAIQDDIVLVAIGGKSEALMDRAEIEEQKVGDEIEAVVVKAGSEVRISVRLASGRKSLEELRQALESGLPVEGKVSGRNKGGYEVRVGGLRGFCPYSQMGLSQGEDQDSVLGKSFDFAILEMSDNGRRLVMSREALLRDERDARAAEVWAKIVVGVVLPGTVRSVTKFGAFVDIGGVEGLVHVSEISRRRIERPADVLTPGDAVRVKVIKIEPETRRLSLSMKELEDDPWTGAAQKYGPGDTFQGRVVRAVDFGLFVEVEPGLEGLVHVSQLPRGSKVTDEAFGPGSILDGYIREVDSERRRLSLSLREVAKGDPWKDAVANYPLGSLHEGVVDKGVAFGAFVQLEPGLTGLIPLSEMEIPQGADPGRVFSGGQKVQVKVLSIDPEARRISLSLRGAVAEAERREYTSFVQAARPERGGSSAFADALRQALGQKGK